MDELGEIVTDEIPEFRLTSFYDLNMVRQISRFVRFLRSSKIDIVQSHDFYSNIFGMLGARIAGIPVRIAAKRETGMRSTRQLFIERRAFGLASALVANAEEVRKYLTAAGVDDEKIHVIHNGIDFSRFDVSAEAISGTVQELGLPDGYRFITLVANLRSRVKDHAMFLRAAQIVAGSVKDAGFILAGEGELVREMKQMAAELGIAERTYFLGRCDRIPELLSASEICVLSSRSEGFSNSIIEYMAAGKPVVATDVGGAAEAIVDGKTGYLVPAGDSESMAEAISGLLHDSVSAEQFGREGRARALERFSTQAQLEGTMALYESQLRQNARK